MKKTRRQLRRSMAWLAAVAVIFSMVFIHPIGTLADENSTGTPGNETRQETVDPNGTGEEPQEPADNGTELSDRNVPENGTAPAANETALQGADNATHPSGGNGTGASENASSEDPATPAGNETLPNGTEADNGTSANVTPAEPADPMGGAGPALLAPAALGAPGLLMAPTPYQAGSEGIEIVISDLKVNPASAERGARVRVTFNYQFTLTATGTAYFKAGDTVSVRTNFTEMFTSDSSFEAPVNDLGLNELGKLRYDAASGLVTFTVNEAAQNMEYHTFTGTFDSFSHFNAAQPEETTNYTVAAGIGAGEATTPFTIVAPGRKLEIRAVGHGTVTPAVTSLTLEEGDSYSFEATPEVSTDPQVPYELLGVTFVRADGEVVFYDADTLPTTESRSYTIRYEDLKPGINTLNFAFTVDEVDTSQDAWGFMDYNDMWKNVWGVDWGSYAQNDISIGGAAVTELYASMGARMGSNASDKSHYLKNLIIEERIPGGTAGTIRNNQVVIAAVLPNYWPIKNTAGEITGYKAFRVEAGRIGGWGGRVQPLGYTDLISAGLITRLDPSASESYDAFLDRIRNTPLSYGIHVDPDTQDSSILINLGSPGDPDGPGWKCSQLWPEQLALDPVLNTINGDGNCIGGKVQAFRLWFYTDHSKTRFTTTYTNNVYYSAETGNGTAIDRARRSASYTINRDNAVGQGHKSTLTVHVVDALDQSQDISDVEVKLEKWNENTSAWEDAVHEGRTIQGSTGDDGILILGESDGSVETGTLTPGRYRIQELTLPGDYSAKTMKVITAPSSQGPISEDGEFTVAATDTKGFVAVITNTKAYDLRYHANGGSGELICPKNPHTAGSKVKVLPPGDAITRSGFYFVGWNTQADGEGEWHAPNTELTMPASHLDLYAQWKLMRGATTTLRGTKRWDDLGEAAGSRPAITDNNGQPLTLELTNLNDYEFPAGTTAPSPSWTVGTDADTWVFTYEDLPQYDESGAAITWTVTETAPEGYTVSYENTPEWDYMTDRAYPGGVIVNRLTDTSYKVESYYQDRTTGEYPGEATVSVTREGLTDEACEVTAEDKVPDSDHLRWVFDADHSENVLDGTVAMDGSTTLKLYFKAQYSVSYLPGDHGTFRPQIFDGLSIGDEIPPFTGPMNNNGDPMGEEGWTFDGWELQDGTSGRADAGAHPLQAFFDLFVLKAHAESLGRIDAAGGDRVFVAKWKKAAEVTPDDNTTDDNTTDDNTTDDKKDEPKDKPKDEPKDNGRNETPKKDAGAPSAVSETKTETVAQAPQAPAATSNVPGTGDDSHAGALAAAAAFSAVALMVFMRRRRQSVAD